MLGAVVFAHEQMQPVIDLIIDLAEEAPASPSTSSRWTTRPWPPACGSWRGADARAFAIRRKQDREAAIEAAVDAIKAGLTEEERADPNLKPALKALESSVLRGDIVRGGRRIDGRGLDVVRPIVSQTGLLPRTHGSALFTRGETQALVVTTLGTGDDEQFIDALHGNFKETSCCTTTSRPIRWARWAAWGAGPREIGHGKLAWRALQAVLPAPTTSPTRSASCPRSPSRTAPPPWPPVCGGSLSMMDAGVPLKAPVAGVAMGLVLEEDGQWACSPTSWATRTTWATWTSRSRAPRPDHLAPDGHQGRGHHARDHGQGAGAGPRGPAAHPGRDEQGALGPQTFSAYAPRIETMQIPTDKIREVIGSGGKVIREIVEVSGAKVDINDDGTIKIASSNGEAIKKAYDMIWSIVAEPEEGGIYKGTVVKIVDFGAFVNFFGKRDGLVHVSQIENRRLNHPSDALKEGQEVWVKLWASTTAARCGCR
jgi:polyribonucleotide nucleotidyltransferase